MKPYPCFETNKCLEEVAAHAEARKNQAIHRLMGKLGPKGAFEEPMNELINADNRASQESGR
jgi:hypothetical protein